jgi:hypothetical protein
MSRARQTFRQRDVTKALKGAVASGLDISGVEIDTDGKIRVLVGKPQSIKDAAHSTNEWDTAA